MCRDISYWKELMIGGGSHRNLKRDTYIRRSRNALILDNRRSGAVALPCIFMNVIRLTIIEWGSQRDGGLLQFF